MQEKKMRGWKLSFSERVVSSLCVTASQLSPTMEMCSFPADLCHNFLAWGAAAAAPAQDEGSAAQGPALSPMAAAVCRAGSELGDGFDWALVSLLKDTAGQ